MKQQDWTQQLSERLADYQPEVPADLWDGIEERLEAAAKPQHTVLWWRWAAAAAVFAVAVGGGIVWWRMHGESVENSGTTAEVVVKAAIAAEQSVPRAEYPGTAPPLPCRGGAGGGVSNEPAPKEIQAPPLTPPLEGRGAPDEQKMGEAASPTPPQQTLEPRTAEDRTSDMPTSLPRKRTGRLTASVYLSGGGNNQQSQNGVLMSSAMAANYPQSFSSARMAKPIYLAGYEEHQHHHLPLSVGLSIGYALSNRLSLTTGLVYTRQQSDFEYLMRGTLLQKEQTLHYVGVPLSLRYQLLRWHGLSVYLAAGGQADFNVRATLLSDGRQQDIMKDRTQWSLNGSLGLQYDLIPQLSVYAEPGISHYIDNGSPISNYFKDLPTSFSLQVGLRLNVMW